MELGETKNRIFPVRQTNLSLNEKPIGLSPSLGGRNIDFKGPSRRPTFQLSLLDIPERPFRTSTLRTLRRRCPAFFQDCRFPSPQHTDGLFEFEEAF